jgi:hypothetical protein
MLISATCVREKTKSTNSPQKLFSVEIAQKRRFWLSSKSISQRKQLFCLLMEIRIGAPLVIYSIQKKWRYQGFDSRQSCARSDKGKQGRKSRRVKITKEEPRRDKGAVGEKTGKCKSHILQQASAAVVERGLRLESPLQGEKRTMPEEDGFI